MLPGRCVPALTAIALIFCAAISAKADSAVTELAALNGGPARSSRATALPSPLSESDAALYRQAFEHQRLGQTPAADRDISHVENPLLIGHVLAARYLAPNSKATGEDLAGWMARFADLPEANEIFSLAKAKLGARANQLKAPARHAPSGAGAVDELGQWDDDLAEPAHGLSPADKRRWQVLRDRIRWSSRHDRQDQAAAMLENEETARLFSPLNFDHLRAELAMGYFVNGMAVQAHRLADSAAERSGDHLPEAHWIAGLAAWRVGDRTESAHHFEAVANAPGQSSWITAAGSFWAARANLAAHRPQVVNHWLQQASAYPRTFYGLLARRALGQDIEFSWQSHPFTEADSDLLAQIPAAQRAMALIQIGDRARADDEIRQILPAAGQATSRSLLALAHDGELPDASVQAASLVAARDGSLHDAGDYPLPNWKPKSGWTIDRSLLLAIARQESGFNPRARNPSGASGLMQLMPATIRALGGIIGKTGDPEANLELGQRYVRRLLDADGVHGNLLCLAAAYNVGPGTVAHWMQTIKPGDDALLFLESMPFRETRYFVEHVLTNFWAYRDRFDQSSPSLDAIAAGRWPMYDAPQSKTRMISYVQN